jgi:SnoaL-like domain
MAERIFQEDRAVAALPAGTLETLLDETAIKRVHLEYCRGVDRRDWDLVRSCYHSDALDHHGPYTGGIDGFIDWAIEFLEQVDSLTHFVGNQLVTVKGDEAWHEAYCRSYHRLKPTETSPALDWIMNVRYLDRFERRDGVWKIADRLVVADTDRRDLVAGDARLGPEWNPGSADEEDPSYNRELPWTEFLDRRRNR